MIAVALFAAASVNAMALPVRVADGASWNITADHSREVVRDGKTEGWSLRTEKRVTWRKGGVTHNTELTVTPLSATPGPGSPPELAAGRSFPTSVTIEVDDTVAPVGFVDPPAVRKAFADIVKRDLAGQTSMADAAAMAMIASELAIASRGQDAPLVAGKPTAYEALLPGPLLGLQVSAKAVYALESHDPATGRAVVTWKQDVDPDSFKAGVAEFLKIVAKAKPQDLEKARTELGAMTMTRTDSCRYTINLASGLATNSECTFITTVTSGAKTAKTTETWAVTQTLPEKS